MNDPAVRRDGAPLRGRPNPYRGAPLPINEEERLRVLQAYRLLDTDEEQSYDDLTFIAATVCAVPIAMVTLVDCDRQWFKSKIGMESRETLREVSFCARAILEPGEVLEVPNALEDARFADNPLVTEGEKIRFYAGVPLVTREGAAVGTICVIDRKPGKLNAAQEGALRALARRVVAQMELRQAAQELETHSLTDALTGAWNRRAFQMRLQEEWARQSRADGSLALLMIDIDGFKSFNDSFGHPEGDAVLQAVTRLLGESLRRNDYLVRYGGEEFSILLSGCALSGATILAERARLAVRSAKWIHRPVTISTGVSVALPREGEDPYLLIARADHALYEAKRRGRDRVAVFEAWVQGETDAVPAERAARV